MQRFATLACYCGSVYIAFLLHTLSLLPQLFLCHYATMCQNNVIITMSADYEYFRSNRENIPLPIQMRISQKPKTNWCNLIAFLQSTLNLKHFEKNEPHRLSISGIIDSVRHGYLNT